MKQLVLQFTICGECKFCAPVWQIGGWVCTAFDDPIKVNPNDLPPQICPLEDVIENEDEDDHNDIQYR